MKDGLREAWHVIHRGRTEFKKRRRDRGVRKEKRKKPGKMGPQRKEPRVNCRKNMTRGQRKSRRAGKCRVDTGSKEKRLFTNWKVRKKNAKRNLQRDIYSYRKTGKSIKSKSRREVI